MTRRNKPLTPREHLALGAELSEINNRLTAALLAVQGAYGVQAGERVRGVQRRLEALRSWLDRQVCAELPRSIHTIEGVPIVQAYYGWRTGPDRPSDRGLNAGQARERLKQAAEHVFDNGNPWLVERPRPDSR